MDQIVIKLLEKLDSKIDRVEDRLTSIEKLDVVQTEQLKQHMERTLLAEENLDILRKEVEPLKFHVNLVNNLAKMAVAFLGVSGALIVIVKTLSKIIH